MIRVFLVEDEPPAMRKLERLSAEAGDLEVCGSAATVAEAATGIAASYPDLVILDIRLPDGTGFEVLQALETATSNRTPQVIFMTAYDEYAVEAFDVAALDYLLKPVSQDRFLAAIDRARDRQTHSLRAPQPKYLRRFLVEQRKSAYFLPVESVTHIVADRNYARLCSESGEFAIRATIEGLEKRLDPSEFVRVNRSVIVQVAAIKEVRSSDNAHAALLLRSGDEISCSKKYWNSALERLI
jgi:two-component system LytT family response regulator